MYNCRQRIDALLVDQRIKANQGCRLEAFEMIVKRGITATDGFQTIEKIEYDFTQGKFENQRYLATEKLHVFLHAPLFDAQRYHRANIGLGYLLVFGAGQANTAMVFVSIIMLTVIGIIAYLAVILAERRVLSYLPKRAEGRMAY